MRNRYKGMAIYFFAFKCARRWFAEVCNVNELRTQNKLYLRMAAGRWHSQRVEMAVTTTHCQGLYAGLR